MGGGVKMLGGMLVLRRIAASHVPAFQAHSQMYPRIAGLDAILANMFGRIAELNFV
jgi:hypothetical protein